MNLPKNGVAREIRHYAGSLFVFLFIVGIIITFVQYPVLESNKEISYKLVGQDEANISKNLIFYRSPIGKALIGKNKDDMISVNTPSGERNFEIKHVEYI